MKTLIMVRHAKSSWSTPGEADFDRNLNERGKKDAPEMAARLKKRGIRIDCFVSSPAKRAKQTCKAFCEIFNFEVDNILFIDKLYHAPQEVYESIITGFNNDDDVVAVFSHNPGITDYVNQLNGEFFTNNMPTCAIFSVQANIEKWNDFKDAEKDFYFYDYPKNEAES